MAFFLYVGTEPREFPAEEGVTVFSDSFSVQVGDIIDTEVNPDPRWFDPTDQSPREPGGDVAAQVEE